MNRVANTSLLQRSTQSFHGPRRWMEGGKVLVGGFPTNVVNTRETTHRQSLAHALPTCQVEDPDLAFIVAGWDRLADGCKRVLIETARANLPKHETKIGSPDGADD